MSFTQYLFKMQDELVVKSKEKNVLQKFDVIFHSAEVQEVSHSRNSLLYSTQNIFSNFKAFNDYRHGKKIQSAFFILVVFIDALTYYYFLTFSILFSSCKYR